MGMNSADRAKAREVIEQAYVDGHIDEQELDAQLSRLRPDRTPLWSALAAGLACLLIGGAVGIEVGRVVAEGDAPVRVMKQVTHVPVPVMPAGLHYPRVVDLRDAAKAAGFDCPAWQQHNRVTMAVESGSCSGSDVLSIYQGPEDAAYAAMSITTFVQPRHLLVGENWIINASADRLRELQPKLGGNLWLE